MVFQNSRLPGWWVPCHVVLRRGCRYTQNTPKAHLLRSRLLPSLLGCINVLLQQRRKRPDLLHCLQVPAAVHLLLHLPRSKQVPVWPHADNRELLAVASVLRLALLGASHVVRTTTMHHLWLRVPLLREWRLRMPNPCRHVCGSSSCCCWWQHHSCGCQPVFMSFLQKMRASTHNFISIVLHRCNYRRNRQSNYMNYSVMQVASGLCYDGIELIN